MPNKPSRTTFHQRLNEMVDSLRSDIENGKLKNGQFIPSINQLSKLYSLSINSVQKGLDQLEEDSLIERIPRIGIRVTSAAQEATTISIGCYPSLIKDIELEAIIEQFHKDYPNIRVKLVPLQYEHYNDNVKYYLDNHIVDAFTVNHINYTNFTSQFSNYAELLEPLPTIEGIRPYLRKLFLHEGSQLVQPIVFSPVVLCYNKQLIGELEHEAQTPNWTWQVFMNCLDQAEMQRGLSASFYFYPSNSNRWPIFLLQSVGSLSRDSEGRIDFSSPSVLDAIQTCYDLIHRGKQRMLLISDNDFNIEDMFANQKVAVIMTTYFNLNKLRNQASFPFELVPLPHVHTPKTLLVTIGLAVNKRSRQKEEAITFVNYLASYKAQLHIRQHTYSIPALQEAADWMGEEVMYRPATFNMYEDIVSSFAQLPDLGLNRKEIDSLLTIMNMYWSDLITKEDTISYLSLIGKETAGGKI